MPTQIRTAQIQDLAITNPKQNFGTPSIGTDVVILSYLQTYVADAIGAGNLKDAVRVATTVSGTLATSFANGQTIDGVTLVTGDRILIKNQSSGQENGIYTVNVSGAPTRSTDADTATDIADAVVYVSVGTVNADTGWKLVTDSITLGTTPLVFTSLTGSGNLTSGNFVTRETPSGTINGSNVSFTLAFTPTVGTETVYLNGLEQNLTTDYTISGSTITYGVAPISGDILRVSYLK
jgi:hypothetical protein